MSRNADELERLLKGNGAQATGPSRPTSTPTGNRNADELAKLLGVTRTAEQTYAEDLSTVYVPWQLREQEGHRPSWGDNPNFKKSSQGTKPFAPMGFQGSPLLPSAQSPQENVRNFIPSHDEMVFRGALEMYNGLPADQKNLVMDVRRGDYGITERGANGVDVFLQSIGKDPQQMERNPRAYEARKKLRDAGYTDAQIDLLAETVDRVQNEEYMKGVRAKAGKGTVGDNIKAVASAPFRGLAGAAEMADTFIDRGFGRTHYDTPDINKPGYALGEHAAAVRSATKENIRESGGKFLGAVYGAGTSFADSMARYLTLGKFGLAAAGLDTMQSGFRDAVSRGGSAERAAVYGAAVGALEVLTEKIPLEKLLNGASPANPKELLKAIGGHGFTEMLGEDANLGLSLIADALIMGDKSEMNTAIRNSMLSGNSREAAVRDYWGGKVNELMETSFESFLSGGASAGAKGGYDMYTGKKNRQGGTQAPAEAAAEAPKEQQKPKRDMTYGELIRDSAMVAAADGTKRKATVSEFNSDTANMSGSIGGINWKVEQKNGSTVLTANRHLGDEFTVTIPNGNPASTWQAALREYMGNPYFAMVKSQILGDGKPSSELPNYSNERAVATVREAVKGGATKEELLSLAHDAAEEEGYIENGADRVTYKSEYYGYLATLYKGAAEYVGKHRQETQAAEAEAPNVFADSETPGTVDTPVTAEERQAAGEELSRFMSGEEVQPVPPVQEASKAAAPKSQSAPAAGEVTTDVPDSNVGKTAPAPDNNVGTTAQTQAEDVGADGGYELTIDPDNGRDYEGSVELPDYDATDNPDFGGTSKADRPDGVAESVGAADAGFTGHYTVDYNAQLSDDNVQRTRPDDVRFFEVPKRDTYGRRVSETVGNIAGSNVIPDEGTKTIEMLEVEGALGFDPQTNSEALKTAQEYIRDNGEAKTRNEISKAVANETVKPGQIEQAMLLLQKYSHRESQSAQDNAAEIMVDLVTLGHLAGRNLQLFNILRKMTPEGQLMAVKKTIEREAAKYNAGRSEKKQAKVETPKELEDAFRRATTQKEKENAMKAIYENAASQMPGTLAEKWDAWRHMAMLFSVPTQARNIGGNTAMMPYARMKNAIGAALEKVAGVKKGQRTKSVLGFSKEAQKMLSLAKADARSEVAGNLMEGNAKVSDQARNMIQNARKVFKSKILEGARTGLYAAMEAEDNVFKRSEYAHALASFLKARGYTSAQWEAGQIPADQMAQAQQHAAQEALKATFNDRNAFSDLVSKRMRADKKGAKTINAIVDSVLPFRRTPANVVARIADYSPAGLAKGIKSAAVDVKKGKVSAAEAIDQIAAGLTGSAAAALGYALASGVFEMKLVGAEDDEDERRTGRQPYSIEIGDKSFTIDWAAPANIPLFVGANLYKSLHNDDRDDVSIATALFDTTVKSLEPLLELSMLSSVNDLVKSASYADDSEKVYSILSTAATSYLMQALPTLAGQFDRAFENRKQIYAESQDPVIREAQKLVGKATKKLPGDAYQIEYVDAWGRTDKGNFFESVFSPTYYSKIDSTPADDEIKRLNAAQDENVSPNRPKNSVTINGEKVMLTGKQFEDLAKEQGQLSLKIVSDLIKQPDYRKLSDVEKAAAINSAYDYAREFARKKHIPQYTEYDSKWMNGIEGNEAKTILERAKVSASGLTDARYASAEEAGFSLDQMKTVSGKVEQKLEGVAERTNRATYEAVIDSVPESEVSKWLKVYGMADSRIESYEKVTGTGVSSEKFFDMWDAYKEIGKHEGSAGDHAMEWAVMLDKAVGRRELTQRQRNAIYDGFTYYSQTPQEAKSYHKMTDGGMKPDVAASVAEFMVGLSKVADQMQAIGKSKLSEADKRTAAEAYLTDAQVENMNQITGVGYNYADYVRLYDIYQNTASGRKKKEVTCSRIMHEYGVDYRMAEWIYKVYAG